MQVKDIEIVCSGCSWVISVSHLSEDSFCSWCFEELNEKDAI